MKILIVHEKPRAKARKRGKRQKQSSNLVREIVIVVLIILVSIGILLGLMALEFGGSYEGAEAAIKAISHPDGPVPVLAGGLAALVLDYRPAT